jgi:hypothetical protein
VLARLVFGNRKAKAAFLIRWAKASSSRMAWEPVG